MCFSRMIVKLKPHIIYALLAYRKINFMYFCLGFCAFLASLICAPFGNKMSEFIHMYSPTEKYEQYCLRYTYQEQSYSE